MKSSLTYYFKGLLHLVFPELCLVCGIHTPVKDGLFCIKCLAKLPYTHFERESENTFTKHFKSRFPVASGAALFFLNRGSGIERMLYLLKYGNRPDIGVKLGEFYGEFLKELDHFSGLDAIVPVPLHPKKMAKRGYNQSEQFAIGIGRMIGVPVKTELLRRTRFTQTQTKMNRAERVKNTEAAFAGSEQLRAKKYSILLIDDVLTTGATFEGCIQAIMHQNKETKVHLITIAMGHSI
jgi:ComF family protein